MANCKRCHGSGHLFRPRLSKFVWFRICPKCGGRGTSQLLVGPKTIRIHSFKNTQSHKGDVDENQGDKST